MQKRVVVEASTCRNPKGPPRLRSNRFVDPDVPHHSARSGPEAVINLDQGGTLADDDGILHPAAVAQ